MDRAFRRGGTLRGWEERRGTEGTKEPLGWRNNCSGEGALAGWGVAAAAAAEEIGAGLGRVGCGGGETGQRLAWLGGDASSRGHGRLLDLLSEMTWRPTFLFLFKILIDVMAPSFFS
jgi:hypothetical protein